jgi:RNA polymerase sigma-70 factor (ECF subfamily)
MGDLVLPIANDSAATRELLRRVHDGDDDALEKLLETQRDYLRKLVDLRMEDELRGRVDPSDVVQETLMVVSRRVDDFLDRRPTSFRLWVRRKAIERLIENRRKHLADKRSVRRELNLSDASSMAVARNFLRGTPSRSLERREMAERVRRAMSELGEIDREVILLRHVEELSNGEVAEILELDPDTASKRYGRAVRRLATKMNETGSA